MPGSSLYNFNPRWNALKISLIYFTASIIWIIVSDSLLELYFSPDMVTQLQTVKGTVFIILTSILIYILIYRDFIAIKKAEKSFIKTKEKFELLVKGVKDYAIFMIDPSGKIVSWNAGAELIYGYNSPEVMGKNFSIFFPPESVQKGLPQKELEIASLKGNKYFEGWRINKKGLKFWASSVITTLYDKKGIVSGYSNVIRDLTDLKNFEENIRANNDYLAAIIDSSPLAIYDLDLEGKIKSIWNPAAENIFGWKKEEVINKTLPIITKDNTPDFMKLKQKIMDDEPFTDLRLQTFTKEGKETYLSFSAAPLHDSRGKVNGIMSIAADISKQVFYLHKIEKLSHELEIKVEDRTKELLEANEKLKELDKLKSLFIASMSHELRTPLNSIIGFTSVILQGMTGDINPEQEKQLNIVKYSANHLLSMINDIIDLSKIEAGKVDFYINEFDYVTLVKEVITSFENEINSKNIRLSLDLPSTLFLKSDEQRVRQILMNMASNAVKFTEEGKIDIYLSKKCEKIIFCIKDTGIGIKQEDLSKLFQPFSRINVEEMPSTEGTGLGLYLSKKLSKNLGGDLMVRSEYGKGSTFKFTLPVERRSVDEKDTGC